jgi:hypothetical protein
MMLQIDKGSTLKCIQKQFNTHFPFLKIEFFKKDSVGQPLYKTELMPLAELNKKLSGFSEGVATVDIDGKRTVLEVENAFEKILDLSAHIFRKSGNVWVETTLTNDWPLEEQNEEGEQISSHFPAYKKKNEEKQ